MYKLEDRIPFNHYYYGDLKDKRTENAKQLNSLISFILENLIENDYKSVEITLKNYPKKITKFVKKAFEEQGYYTKYIYGGKYGDPVSLIISVYKFRLT